MLCYCIILFFLFQGGFAHCYELIDTDTKAIYAGKIVPKSMLTKPHQKDKVNSYATIPMAETSVVSV